MKREHLPPLKSLQAFEAVARTGSVVRAAEALHVTQGAVSKQLRQLEEALGVALFERRNRGVHLTAAGQQLHQACTQALQTLAQAVEAVRAPAPTRPLVLSCEPTLAMHWLIPRLPQLQAACAGVQLHLVAGGGAVDFERDGIDIALRRNDFALQPHWQVHAVAPEYMGPVAQPALAQRWLSGDAAGPADLADFADLGDAAGDAQLPTALVALHSATRPQAWANWWAGSFAGNRPADLPQRMVLEHFYLSLQAAISGLGVAMASVYMAATAVQTGSLAAPLGWRADGTGYVLIHARGLEDARTAQVHAWLQQAMAETLAQNGLGP